MTPLKELLESNESEAADFIVDAKSRFAGVLYQTRLTRLPIVSAISILNHYYYFHVRIKCSPGRAAIAGAMNRPRRRSSLTMAKLPH